MTSPASEASTRPMAATRPPAIADVAADPRRTGAVEDQPVLDDHVVAMCAPHRRPPSVWPARACRPGDASGGHPAMLSGDPDRVRPVPGGCPAEHSDGRRRPRWGRDRAGRQDLGAGVRRGAGAVRPGAPDLPRRRCSPTWAPSPICTSGRSVLEVGCGTGQATRSLAALGWRVTAVERGPGPGGAGPPAPVVVPGRRDRDVVVRAVGRPGPALRRPRGGGLVALDRPGDRLASRPRRVRPGGWMAVCGHVVVRRPGELEVYAETADLHERFAPGVPGWGHPPLESEVRATEEGWGPPNDPGGAVRPDDRPLVPDGPVVRRCRVRRPPPLPRRCTGRSLADVREPLLEAITERIRTRLGDHVPRRYVTVLRAGRRIDRLPSSRMTPEELADLAHLRRARDLMDRDVRRAARRAGDGARRADVAGRTSRASSGPPTARRRTRTS